MDLFRNPSLLRYGPVEVWDLFVGANINILGKPTTLMQANLKTSDWIEAEVS